MSRFLQNTKLKLPQFRVALNTQCGRACFYCRPSGEAHSSQPGATLLPDDLLKVAKAVRKTGIDRIKLTGGEPALYDKLDEVVTRLRNEVNFVAVEIISRHPLLGHQAKRLAEAGVTQFNFSIDTLDRAKHKDICGIDDLPEILEALNECIGTGIPCKINTVVMREVNDSEIPALISFSDHYGIKIIKFLDIIADLHSGQNNYRRRLLRFHNLDLKSLYIPLTDLAAAAGLLGKSTTTFQGDLGHPMTAVKTASGLEILIKDSTSGAWYGSICKGCKFYPCHDALMALRLTADCRFQPCLINGKNISVPLIGLDECELDEIVGRFAGMYSDAVFQRPSSH